jgi:hypothetical protein
MMRAARPSTLLGADATITTDGTIDADYPLTNLHDGLPTEITRWTNTTQTRIVWDFGTVKTIEGFLLVMHTVAAAAVVKVQANSSNVWGAPAFSEDLTVGDWSGGLPPNISADLRGTLLATTGYRYASVLLPAGASAHAIGEVIWVPAWDEITIGGVSNRAIERVGIRRVSVNETSYGVQHVVERGVRQRRVRPPMEASDAADRARLMALVDDAGGNLGFPALIDVLSPTGEQTIEALYARFHPEFINQVNESFAFWDAQNLQLDLLEIQRGLPL